MAAPPIKTRDQSAKRTKRPSSRCPLGQGFRLRLSRRRGRHGSETTQAAAPSLTPAVHSRWPERAEHNRAMERSQRGRRDRAQPPSSPAQGRALAFFLPQFPSTTNRNHEERDEE